MKPLSQNNIAPKLSYAHLHAASANLIAPTDLRDFLTVQGWTLRSEGLADRLYVLENKAFKRRQLAFPMEADAPDYGEAVESVLAKWGTMAAAVAM